MNSFRPWPLLLLLFIGTARAQSTAPAGFDRVRVYLVTVGPGKEVFEKFGHNMIRVVGPASVLGTDQDVDVAFNWGMFSFDQPHFIWHFIQGRMLYWVGAWDYQQELAEYRQNDRSVWEQELNLSPAEKERLWSRLLWDIQPANRNYRYDYYRDNCSTRSRDALDEALDGQIRQQLTGIPTHTTYRSQTRRLMQVNCWLYTGLQYVLGHPVDQPLDAWHECFLPVPMMEWIDKIHVTNANGQQIPLVMNQKQIFQSTRYISPQSPPRWIWIYALIGLALAVIFLAPRLASARWSVRLPWGIIAALWSALTGIVGGVLTWGWICTDHVVVRYNENWLQASPIMLLLIVLIPLAVFGKRWAIKAAMIVAGIQALFNVAGLLLKILPWFRQPNFEIIAIALPANVALAIAMWRLSQTRTA